MAFRQRIIITGRHFIMIEVLIHQEDRKIVNTCVYSSRTPPSNNGVRIQVHMEYCVGPSKC